MLARSRLFSISDDVPERISPYRAVGSPTDPFESAELLASDSLPSSPLCSLGGLSAADEFPLLHSTNDALMLSSGPPTWHSSPDSLFRRGRYLQTSDASELPLHADAK
jgi:hypothetical protein